MKAYFLDFLEYTNHYNNVMIDLFLGNEEQFSDRAIGLLNHTINAHQIWNARILKNEEFDVWQINNSKELKEINNNNFVVSQRILEDYDLSFNVDYHNSKGINFKNSIAEIFFHYINHSTYHRGQINQLIKQSGIEPPISDYIFYKRT